MIINNTLKGHNMEQYDIDEVVKILKRAIKTEDWELVEEAQEYLIEYLPDDKELED